MKTTLAIPVWRDQVSTTFDFARKLLVVEAEGARELSRKEIRLKDEPVERKAHTMQNYGTHILLCGAISEPLARAVTQVGIRLIPYVAGPVNDVLGAYLCGRLDDSRFLLPGTRSAMRKGWRQRGVRVGPAG